MKVDGISFATGFVESFKTEKEFLAEMDGEGYKFAILSNDVKRHEKLKYIYGLHHKKAGSKTKEPIK